MDRHSCTTKRENRGDKKKQKNKERKRPWRHRNSNNDTTGTNDERSGPHELFKDVRAHLSLDRSCEPVLSPLIIFLGVV